MLAVPGRGERPPKPCLQLDLRCRPPTRLLQQIEFNVLRLLTFALEQCIALQRLFNDLLQIDGAQLQQFDSLLQLRGGPVAALA